MILVVSGNPRLSHKSVLKVTETSRPVITQDAIGSVIPAKAGIQKK